MINPCWAPDPVDETASRKDENMGMRVRRLLVCLFIATVVPLAVPQLSGAAFADGGNCPNGTSWDAATRTCH
jgi:hypothetical protein